jgi:hypothetical protein
MQVCTMGLGEYRHGRLGKALQPIDHGEQDIFHAAVAQFIHHPEPELGTLVLLQPEAKDFLAAVGPDAERDVHRLVADQALVPDLHPQRVEEHQRADRLQRPRLPSGNLIQHRVGHRADQVGRYLDAIQIQQGGPRSRACSSPARRSVERTAFDSLSSKPGKRR